jgi:hypothetical protein
MHVAPSNNINQSIPASSHLAPRLHLPSSQVVRSPQAGIMAGATFIFAWLTYASLFASQVQAGWEMLSPGGMPNDVAKRQNPPNPNGPRTVIDAGFGMLPTEHVAPQ